MMYDDEPSCRNLANKPLATLPTWGEVDFKTLTPEQVAEKEVQQRETALRIKKQKTEDEAEFWEAKKARYASAIAKVGNDGGSSDSTTCPCVFDTMPDALSPGPFQCPYDRKEGSIFCAMCKVMAEAVAA